MIEETTKNLWIGIARTAAPLLAGYVISLFIWAGLDLSPEMQEQITFLIFSGISLAYYVVAALFERYVSPKFGWLLGIAKKPAYTKTIEENVNVGKKDWGTTPLVNGDEGRAG